ncbi:MAG: hypothetical protein RIR96_1085 [Bacteroidota bacterium]
MKSQIKYIVAGATIIIATLILSKGYNHKYRINETISVTGLSEVDFMSDLIVWGGSFSRTAIDLQSAYSMLKNDELEIRKYLNKKGIPDSSLVFSSVSMNKNFTRKFDDSGNEISSEFSGYTLTGNIRVESRKIDLVEKMSREITELLEMGIELNSNAPEYYYTKLNELKIDLLAKASADANKRAETIASNSGSSLGSIKKAQMGVFQITGKNSNEDYSFGGSFNTSSKEKTASITLKVDYAID